MTHRYAFAATALLAGACAPAAPATSPAPEGARYAVEVVNTFAVPLDVAYCVRAASGAEPACGEWGPLAPGARRTFALAGVEGGTVYVTGRETGAYPANSAPVARGGGESAPSGPRTGHVGRSAALREGRTVQVVLDRTLSGSIASPRT
ncbi:MAG TPA: hypothetical protein VHG91_12660 [Longimicrobium sp.]|nr:hypothetical protein [Longimicrobium sp.]